MSNAARSWVRSIFPNTSPAFWLWFCTPLITFFFFVLFTSNVNIRNTGSLLNFFSEIFFVFACVSPLLGIFSLPSVLESPKTNIPVLLKEESYRFLYIFVIGAFYFGLNNNNILSNFQDSFVFFGYLSLFYYLIPDITTVLVQKTAQRYVSHRGAVRALSAFFGGVAFVAGFFIALRIPNIL